MPMTTFLGDHEIGKILPDKQMQELLTEVRKRTGEDWQVVPHEVGELRNTWYGHKTVTVTRWSIYKFVGGAGPWMVINFYNPDPDGSSIYHLVGLDVIGAFLCGMVNGLDKAERP